MKRMFLVVLALCLCLCGVSVAEGDELFDVFEVYPGEPLTIDLDGDGYMEFIECYMDVDYEYGMETVVLNVTSENGVEMSRTEMMFNVSIYVADVDSDGLYELFICGDEASDDYYTVCLHYMPEGLFPVLFADGNRGANDGGYYDYGYGYIESIVDGAIRLSGSQDILGTYFGTRAYGLKDGKFEFVDDGLWRFNYYYEEVDEESWDWEYFGLMPKMDIPAMFFDGEDEYEGVIKAGEKFVVTASDKESVVYFRTRSGAQGYFFVYPDEEAGWGHYINGFYEVDVFEYVPYAD